MPSLSGDAESRRRERFRLWSADTTAPSNRTCSVSVRSRETSIAFLVMSALDTCFTHFLTRPFGYYPDATFQTKTDRLYLFEVLDSEERAQSQVVAHVVESFLTPNVLKSIFIVKTDRAARKVDNIVKVVIGNLDDLSKGGMNKTVRFYEVVIPESDARSLAKVRAILTDPKSGLGIVLKKE